LKAYHKLLKHTIGIQATSVTCIQYCIVFLYCTSWQNATYITYK